MISGWVQKVTEHRGTKQQPYEKFKALESFCLGLLSLVPNKSQT